MNSAPALDGNALTLMRELREAANSGNKPVALQILLRKAADRIEADAIRESQVEYCYQGCKAGGSSGNPLFGFGDNSPFL